MNAPSMGVTPLEVPSMEEASTLLLGNHRSAPGWRVQPSRTQQRSEGRRMLAPQSKNSPAQPPLQVPPVKVTRVIHWRHPHWRRGRQLRRRPQSRRLRAPNRAPLPRDVHPSPPVPHRPESVWAMQHQQRRHSHWRHLHRRRGMSIPATARARPRAVATRRAPIAVCTVPTQVRTCPAAPPGATPSLAAPPVAALAVEAAPTDEWTVRPRDAAAATATSPTAAATATAVATHRDHTRRSSRRLRGDGWEHRARTPAPPPPPHRLPERPLLRPPLCSGSPSGGGRATLQYGLAAVRRDGWPGRLGSGVTRPGAWRPV